MAANLGTSKNIAKQNNTKTQKSKSEDQGSLKSQPKTMVQGIRHIIISYLRKPREQVVDNVQGIDQNDDYDRDHDYDHDYDQGENRVLSQTNQPLS